VNPIVRHDRAGRVGPMLTGKRIVCLSSINWDFNWQGHQEVMARLAAAGNTVLFVENTGVRMPRWRDLSRLRARFRDWKKGTQGIRQVREGLYVCSPLVLPFPYSVLAQLVNRWLFIGTIRCWMDALGFDRPIIWTFLPTRFVLDVIDQLDPEAVVYYCIADFEQLAPVQKVRRAEQALLRRADVVFAQGEVLAARCRQYHRHPVDVVPFGVNLEQFEGSAGRLVPGDLAAIPSPRIGYVGALQRHVDGSLLDMLARSHPDWSLVIVGPEWREFESQLTGTNIHQLGAKDHKDVPGYIAGFDVCLIPYRLTAYTQTVFPTKLGEYLMLGKPVVSTALPEVLSFNTRHGDLVAIGATYEEFERHVADALRENQDGQRLRRIEAARMQSWSVKVAHMSRVLDRRLQDSDHTRTSQWSLVMHRSSQRGARRAAGLAVILAVGYLGLFHTPALWWVAAPLKIAEAPQPADAIVVFAGGVGESGQSGQGYEERVQRTVQLFEDGYAKHVILSSGYTSAMKEVDVMKALLTSLGVPESAIVLELKAVNTYENVAFTSRILEAHGWRRVLLVSSPYHMRRADLVWRKQVPNVRVIPTPIAHSRFYGDEHEVKVRHMRAILHEYVGLLYYWWKGWI